MKYVSGAIFLQFVVVEFPSSALYSTLHNDNAGRIISERFVLNVLRSFKQPAASCTR